MTKKWYSKTRKISPEEAAQTRQDRLEKLQEDLVKGVEKVLSSPEREKAIKEMLLWQSKFHHYSFGNLMRLLVQCEERGFVPTYVAGFTTWNKLGYRIKPREEGGTALYVLGPRIKTVENDEGVKESTIIGFGPEAVFDFSQVVPTKDAVPVPNGFSFELIGDSEPGRFLNEKLRELAKYSGIPITYGSCDGASGFYSPSQHRIQLSEGMGPDEECMVLLHELVHSQRHHKESVYREEVRQYKEVIAEGTAFVVSSYFGLQVDDYSFAYVASWAKDVKTVELLGSEIQKEANKIIRQITYLSTDADVGEETVIKANIELSSVVA